MLKSKTGSGILGAGRHNIATDHQLPATLLSQCFQLVALCDPDPGVFEFAKAHQVKAYQDFAVMLADPEIQMVQVATPDQFHCRHALQVLAAGKSVLLQKPPCVNRHEWDELLAAARNGKNRIQMLINQRYSLLSRSIKHYLERFYIGELREIIIRYRGRRFPVDNPASFYLTAASGGVWLHNALHWLDEAYYYSGVLPQEIQIMTNRNDEGASQYLGEGPNYFAAVFPMKHVSFLFEYNTMLTSDGLPGGMERTFIGTHGEIRQNYGSGELSYCRFGSGSFEPLPLLPCEGDSAVVSFQLAMDEFAREISENNGNRQFADAMQLFDLLLKGLGR